MEKRIIPRFQFAQIIFSIHRLSENVSLGTLFETTNRVFLQAFVGVYKELVTKLLNLKAHISKLEKTNMEFITRMDRLGMAHPARKKELTTKKERSLFHVLELERKLKETERNMKAATLCESRNAKTSKMNKLRRAYAAARDREQELMTKLEELKVETYRLVEVLDENLMF